MAAFQHEKCRLAVFFSDMTDGRSISTRPAYFLRFLAETFGFPTTVVPTVWLIPPTRAVCFRFPRDAVRVVVRRSARWQPEIGTDTVRSTILNSMMSSPAKWAVLSCPLEAGSTSGY